MATMLTNEYGEDGEGKRNAVLQKNPLLIDTIMDSVFRMMGPMSLNEALACRGVCRQWRDHLESKLYEIIEKKEIVFNDSSAGSYYYSRIREKSSLSNYQKIMPVKQFLNMRVAAKVEPLPGILFRRFRFQEFPLFQLPLGERVVEFFQEFGPNIQSLHLSENRWTLDREGMESKYRDMLLSCPNLEKLSVVFAAHDETVFNIDNETHPTTAIKKLAITSCRASKWLDSSFLIFLLMASPQLESLNLTGLSWPFKCLSEVDLQRLPCFRNLKNLRLITRVCSMATFSSAITLKLQSLRIGFIYTYDFEYNQTLGALLPLLQSQSQSLVLLSIQDCIRTRETETPEGRAPFPVMPKLKYLQLDICQLWKKLNLKYFDRFLNHYILSFSTPFPNLKTLAIGRVPQQIAKAINIMGELHCGVESLELQIAVDNSLQAVMIPKKFPNLKILEISIHLCRFPEAQEIRKIWEIRNLESLYLTLEFNPTWLENNTLGQFFRGLREWEWLRFCNSIPSPYFTLGDISRSSIINLRKLKHLDINFSLDLFSRQYSINEPTYTFDLNTASFWAFSKLPVLEYFKVSSGNGCMPNITDEQIAMFETAHPRLRREIEYQDEDGTSYKWKIPGVSDPPKKPSQLFSEDV